MHDLGWKQLTSFYRQAVDIAKTITGQVNESEAVSEFKSRLKSYSLYLNKQPFPRNESGEEAFQKCIKSKRCAVKSVRHTCMLLILQDSELSGLESLIENGALVLIAFYSFAIPLSPGGLPYVKRSGMLVVPPRGVNHGFWSHLGNSEQNTTIFCHQGIFNLYSRRNTWSFMTISLGSIFRKKHLSIIKIVETHTYNCLSILKCYLLGLK